MLSPVLKVLKVLKAAIDDIDVGLDMVITICWKPKWYSSQVWKHQLLCSWVFLFQFAIATYKWQIQIKSLENFDCVYYYYNWNKNYSEATVRNDMGLSINSFSFRSVLDRKFVKIVSIWYSIEGPNSLLVNLLTMLIWFSYVIWFISRKALLMCPQYICNLNLWQRKVFKLLDAKLFSLTYF